MCHHAERSDSVHMTVVLRPKTRSNPKEQIAYDMQQTNLRKLRTFEKSNETHNGSGKHFLLWHTRFLFQTVFVVNENHTRPH